MQPKCLQSVVPQNEPSPSAPTLLWPGSLIIPNLTWEVTVVLTKTHQLLPMITFPLPGDQPASPLMETKEFTAPHSSLCRALISCFPWYWSVLRKNSSRDIFHRLETTPAIRNSSFPAQDAQASVSRDSCSPAPVKCTNALAMPEFSLIPRNPLQPVTGTANLMLPSCPLIRLIPVFPFGAAQ